MKNSLRGKKTYIGLVITAIALMYPHIITQTDANSLSELIAGIIGICVSIYGRYSAGK